MAAADSHPRHGLAALLLCSLAAAASAAPSPDAVISAAADNLAALATERRDELERDLSGRYVLLDEYLLAHFDLETACRLMLREHWTSATAAERQRFVSAFYRSVLGTHGRALLSFRHDTISVVPSAAPATGGSASVRTKLRLANGSVYDVDFYLRRDAGGWRIVDVIAEGVSYIRTFRTDFGAEIRATSLEALTRRLESLSSGGGKGAWRGSPP